MMSQKDYGNTTATIPFIKNISNAGLKLNINIKLTLNVSLNNGRAWLIIGQKGLSNSEILNKQLSEGDNVIEINRTDYLLFGNDSFYISL